MIDFTQDITKYCDTLKTTIDATPKEDINQVLNILIEAYEQRQQVFVMGNGGSAATASHLACDFNEGISEGKTKQFRVIALTDNIPSITAIANDMGYEMIFVQQLSSLMEPGDYVIGISGSGNSENVIRAIDYGNEHGAITVGFTGYSGGRLKKRAQHNIHINIDDMQVSEDLHMVLTHIMMRVLKKHLM